MQLESILSELKKAFLQFDMINYKLSSLVNLQPHGVRNSWGTSSTNRSMPTYMDPYQSTYCPQDSWEDGYMYEPSSSQPGSPHNRASMPARQRLASPPCSNIPAPPEQLLVAPKALEICNVNPDNSLPTSIIQTEKLADVKAVLTKYRKLKTVYKASTLAVKLAKEVFFGEDIMEQCTVAGTRDHPGLPFDKLQELKQTVFEQFLQFWQTLFEFEDIWILVSKV